MTTDQIRRTVDQDTENLADLRDRQATFGPRFAREYDARIAKVEAHRTLWTEMLATQVARETAAVAL